MMKGVMSQQNSYTLLLIGAHLTMHLMHPNCNYYNNRLHYYVYAYDVAALCMIKYSEKH